MPVRWIVAPIAGILLSLHPVGAYNLPIPASARGLALFMTGEAELMIRFFKNRIARSGGPSDLFPLGSLEFELMEILWSHGEKSVREVVHKLSRPLAYTTVMTTLDRLFKRGLLGRRKSQRAFVYCPSFSRQEWERRRAEHLVAGFLEGPNPSRQLLLSCLLDAVGEHDAKLLDELEKKIRTRRKELVRQGQP